ncbi:Zinc finger BED domain-containing protein [Quillaja saponaria]|uniref:Zinc finger BED domain-containing protein n=1 Tax=Quillaja saponaria TaxID=32244 RepID=A0AAD7PLF2_QUISA|nr:Zinc finger BED domain-containing protein [Quillaja saponaria]
MIILHEYPLSIVDHIRFKRYSTAIQPSFKVVSRNTIQEAIMKIYESEKEVTMKFMEDNEGTVAITTDMWTASNQKKGFMAILDIAKSYIEVEDWLVYTGIDWNQTLWKL